jgi:hypothetical protein
MRWRRALPVVSAGRAERGDSAKRTYENKKAWHLGPAPDDVKAQHIVRSGNDR